MIVNVVCQKGMIKMIKYNAKELLRPALDCFSGVDGGITFVEFKTLISSLCEKANAGDANSIKVLTIVMQYNKLISLVHDNIRKVVD